MQSKEDIWKEYESLVDLYKFYLALNVSANTLILGIIGGASTYALKNGNGNEQMIFVLLFSAMVSALAGLAYIRYLKPCNELVKAVSNQAKRLKLELPPHTFILRNVTFSLIIIYFLVAIGLVLSSWFIFGSFNQAK